MKVIARVERSGTGKTIAPAPLPVAGLDDTSAIATMMQASAVGIDNVLSREPGGT
jgi:hypothetical protein